MTDAWIHDELAGWSPGFGRHAASDVGPAASSDGLLSGHEWAQPLEPRDTNAIGIDCASYQGTPNWAQVASSGRSFVYIKAGQGTGTSYPTLDTQYSGARAAGLTVGLYWFADPTQSPESNADAFGRQINRLGAVPGHLPPCLDLETGTGDLSGWAQRFITRLRANTGCVRVMVYSSASFFQAHIGESWMDANIALWVAHFGAPPGKPAYLTPRVAIHQYADNGQVAGIVGNVDLDYAVWPLATLVPSATPPAPPPAATAADLTDAQNQALIGVYQQLSGSSTPGQWAGWPSWAGGSGRTLTMLDYLRQADVQLCALKAQVAALQSQGMTPAALSDTDVNRIAAAVAAMLAQRLQS